MLAGRSRTGRAADARETSGPEKHSLPEPRGQEVKVDVDVDELEDNENGELREMMPDKPPPPPSLQ